LSITTYPFSKNPGSFIVNLAFLPVPYLYPSAPDGGALSTFNKFILTQERLNIKPFFRIFFSILRKFRKKAQTNPKTLLTENSIAKKAPNIPAS